MFRQRAYAPCSALLGIVRTNISSNQACSPPNVGNPLQAEESELQNVQF
jgi:hypothetical protein